MTSTATKSTLDPAEDDEALSRELAEKNLQRSLDHIQQAQNLLAKACAEWCPIIGGSPTWRKISAQHDKVKELWYAVDAAGNKLRARGARVDDCNLQYEKRVRIERSQKPALADGLEPEG